jgi:biotin carboxyl carrier protein
MSDTHVVMVPTLQTGAPVTMIRHGVPEGGRVLQGDLLCVLECKKTEYQRLAKVEGQVHWVMQEGQTCSPRSIMCEITQAPAESSLFWKNDDEGEE